jgi:hypothetical protein
MGDATTTADLWCKLEMFGHQTLAGRVSEVEQFGAKMGRLDTPNADGTFTTVLFRPESVFRLTYVTEAAARVVAARNQHLPASSWDLPQKAKDALYAAEREEQARKVAALAPAEIDRLADDGGPHAVREDEADEDDASDILF